VADAVRAAAPLRGWAMTWYVDYETRRYAINLSSADQEIKRREFYAYDQTMTGAGYESYASNSWYLAWLLRTYSRTQQVALTAPAAPTNLAATAASATQIDLSWTDNALSESQYRVHRSTTPGFTPSTTNQIATLAPDVVAYTDNGVAGSTTYYYRVVAANAAGTAASAEASATTPAPAAQLPAGPTNLLGTTVSSSQIALAWTDNATNETGFRVERAPDVAGVAGAYATVVTQGADATSYEDAGLAPGTAYWYRVIAFNGDGDSGASNAIRVTTADSPPSGLTVTGSTSSGKGKGSLRSELRWTTGTAARIDVWRNGARIVSGATNTGAYGDSVGNKRGTYTYQVCLAGLTGTTNCTNTASVTY
jgi:fibronectin type 3 domain-containing protein